MPLIPTDLQTIPAETRRVARLLSPKVISTCAYVMSSVPCTRTKPLPLCFRNVDGPRESPGRLALITAFQFAEGLSNRAAAAAVQSRIDWKYALGLELTDAGLDASVLAELRARLVASDQAQMVKETCAGYPIPSTMQAIDSRCPPLSLSAPPQHEALQRARQREKKRSSRRLTPSARAWREPCPKACARSGLRRARYVGLAKTRLQYLATAAALNVIRVGAWFLENVRAQARCSAFAALAPQIV